MGRPANRHCEPCPVPEHASTLTLQDASVVFAPDSGTWTLSGVATATTMQATRERPAPEHKTYKTELKAVWTDQTVRGTYMTPLCTYAVSLTRV